MQNILLEDPKVEDESTFPCPIYNADSPVLCNEYRDISFLTASGPSLLPYPNSPPQITLALLKRVQLPVPEHSPVIVAVLIDQSLYP